nr:MAG TPA: hypothetical protein [Caudoviricetes sp.]
MPSHGIASSSTAVARKSPAVANYLLTQVTPPLGLPSRPRYLPCE